jgi:Tol biopolymer transport system component
MALSSGTRIGPYEIQTAVGAGGMGEVYRARDSRLGRDVAVKVLPASFALDADRLRRFEQEARTVAALSHPNIVALFDTGQHQAAPYLVSELLDGETLREKLNAGALSARRAIDYAAQIADGLAAAHDKGIIHRDLKPENIFITKDGRVKILDFGLAKLARADGQLAAGAEGVTSAGVTHTTPGLIVGTAGYMSPEQVRGREVDARTDIFSFGAILYEMLSGQRAFRGDTSVETMNAILKEDPPELDAAALHVSPGLERIVRRCLEKEAEQRFSSARDVKFAIEALSGSTSSATHISLAPRRPHWWNWAGVAAAVLIVTGAIAFALWQRPGASAVRMHFAIPMHGEASGLALSRDGMLLAFVSPDDISGKPMLFVQRIGHDEITALPGTEGAMFPFWSPDNAYIAYFANGKLLKVPVNGGPSQALARVSSSPRGGAWSSKGVIVYSVDAGSILWRVNADGTGAAPLTDKLLAPTDSSHRWPVFLPDGDHFLFFVDSLDKTKAPDAIFLSSLSGREKKFITAAESNPGFTEPGYLLATDSAGHLFARRFDLRKLAVYGDTRTVIGSVGYQPSIFRAEFTAADNGTVVSDPTAASSLSVLTWYDRKGKELGTVGGPGILYNPALSPDGERLAVDTDDLQAANINVWIHDLKRATATRFTFGSDEDVDAVWSPDGGRIAYRSYGKGAMVKQANGLEKERLVGGLLDPTGDMLPDSWSPDERYLVCTNQTDRGEQQLYLIDVASGKRSLLIPGAANHRDGQVSPDGKWLAYQSDESGTWEIYVTTFPAAQGKWQVSQGGGTEPRWRHDGKEIFYISANGMMTAVPVSTESGFSTGSPQQLFPVHSRAPISSTDFYSYDVTRDGQRFLINKYEKPASVPPLDIVLNATK